MALEFLSLEEKRRLAGILLENLRQHAPELRQILEDVNTEWCYEDGIYRYYHHSFKVFNLQGLTMRMADALAAVAPEGRPFKHGFFKEILRQGTGRKFKLEDNKHWPERAGPIVTAFFHLRYFVEMAVKYSGMSELPEMLPYGWAALLYLYGLR